MGLMNIDTIDKHELYENACKQTKAALEAQSRVEHRQLAWKGEIELCFNDIERIRGAAKALEAVFGVHDFYIVGKLGMDEAREKFNEACERQIATA